MNSGFFRNRQGLFLFVEQWKPAGTPKGIVQIAHGMRESTGYYREFCRALADSGYAALVHDARGHGRTAGEPGSEKFRREAGSIGPDGFGGMAEDLAELTDSVALQNPGVPVFLLGHSMGSVLARLYAARFGRKLSGLLYSGTTGPLRPERMRALLEAADTETAARGRQAVASRISKLMFGHFNDRFQPAVTGYEYMSRDGEMVREAIGSPFAAIPYRCGFYSDFLHTLQRADLPENIDRIPKTLPILAFSGDMDPFGEYGEGVRELTNLYQRHGLQASMILYPGGRHEMLRETNRREVFADVIGWLNACTSNSFAINFGMTVDK